MRTNPTIFFRDTILVHESSKHSLDPRDKGNWVGPKLIGSKYGVTAAALAEHRKVSVNAITLKTMSELTEAEAIAVGLGGYYHARGIDLLPWDTVIASVVDLAFNAGPKRAVQVLQELIGVSDDGAAGPATRKAYETWRCKHTPESAMKAWTAARIAFYKGLKNPTYIGGWTNRANSFLPGTAWWKDNA